MKTVHTSQPKGLVLLVVLGMLALFSLLAVTYVVFASQSRASSVALARHNIRQANNKNPLFEEAIKQLIRGTTDPASAMYGHDVLGDLYGDRESLPTMPNMQMLRIRDFQYVAGSPVGTTQMSYQANSVQRPMLLGGQVVSGQYVPGKFLRIPINAGAAGSYGMLPFPPAAHEALTGRVMTFPEGQGPLGGHSFRIVRYVGYVDPTEPPELFAQCYSITIDLSEIDLGKTYSTRDVGTGALVTSKISDWMLQVPPVTGVSTWASGVYLCYANVDLAPATKYLSQGYSLFVNATTLNTHGVGILNDGTSQQHFLSGPAASEPNMMSVALQGRYQSLLDTSVGTLDDPLVLGVNATSTIVGDSDEPYDAPDMQNWFLASRDDVVSGSSSIIPSFHRAALINYIVNWKDPAQYTEAEFLATLRRIQLAVPRPLSINVTTPSSSVISNPTFTGSNVGNSALSLTIASPWNTNWPTSVPAFYSWLDFLTQGPWDIDNDSDNVTDGIWLDLGMPLQSTPDGKLLKALVSYYVDDLDNRIDINAAGSVQQTNMVGIYTRPTTFPPNASASPTPATPFARGQSTYLSQGLGFGSADVSFRHLFGKPGLRWGGAGGQDNAELAYQNVMRSRYSSSSGGPEIYPGDASDDGISVLSLRERRVGFRHGALPGQPMAVVGRASFGLDRLGNPFLLNVESPLDESTNDPYESRLVSPAHRDKPFSLSEWERVYRVGDSDRSALPSRVEELFGETSSSIASSSLRNEITTISRHLRVPMLAARSLHNVTAPTSFLELVNAVRQLRGEALFSPSDLAILFPLEFRRGLPLDLNRPFGNGIDDNLDGEIDEPSEVMGGQAAMYVNAAGGLQATTTAEDYFQQRFSGDASLLEPRELVPPAVPTPLTPVAPYFGNESRQLFARHLYCLAQLIVPADYAFPNVDKAYFLELLDTERNGTGADQTSARNKLRELRSRTLAQWAVNVVDFRDSDATMTRFAYDPEPFSSGWGPTRVVWGLEQPELLMTESLAFHDVRVKRDATATPMRIDQYRIPQGSLFLELYCPRTTDTGTNAANNGQVPGVPSSLYTTNASGDVVLDLGRLTPAITGFERFPVWRVYISNSIDKSGAAPAAKTPHERLIAAPPLGYDSPTRNDLTFQLPTSNLAFDTTGNPVLPLATVQSQSGLQFDLAIDASERLADPEADESRIILFARDPASGAEFVPTRANTPGVLNPSSQVFVNRSGALTIGGNQYLVVGPRDITYLGSRSAPAKAGSLPNNAPSNHRIELGTNWVTMVKPNKVSISQRPALRNCVTMIAGANTPGWTGLPATADFIGVNVSEPLPNATDYYPMPSARLNPGDTAADVGETNAPGFANIPRDAYNDYVAIPAPPARAPFDDGSQGPLQNWDLNNDGAPDTLPAANNVVSPGTELDWSTAYLQRLADPDKPWDATFNPYITVDWIPIDLTVFSGEDSRTELDGMTPSFASRQKVGQTIDTRTLAFNTTASGRVGRTFLSALTDTATTPSTASATTGPFFRYELKGDESSARPSAPNGAGAFSTLGFLNSTFVIAAEDSALLTKNTPALPPVLMGAPGDPTPAKDPAWHPDSLYWANRPFVNSIDVMNVPLSSPGQLTQEFSGVNPVNGKESLYAASYSNEGTSSPFAPSDPRMPSSPMHRTTSGTPVFDKSQVNHGSTYGGYTTDDAKGDYAFTPFSHLMNFFQESPEIESVSAISPFPTTDRYAKNTAMALLLDLMETPSAWNDVSTVEPPGPLGLVDPSTFAPELQPLMISNNVVMGPMRAPYNRISRYVEPGRINLNTVRQPSVFQGLWSNTLVPQDIDFPPYAPSTPFGGPEDFDYNENGVLDSGERAAPVSLTAWTALEVSRRGYAPASGYYNPGGTVTTFNPNYPTEFAGIFKPAAEAGMVPKTRPPLLSGAGATAPEATKLATLASQYGLLEVHARQAPAHVTIMRGLTETSGNTAISNAGIPRFGNTPLFQDTTATQRQAFTDRYPMSRLANLVSNRSNVFAVYVTIGLFEFDQLSGALGIEYGADKGEVERYKAFYIIDRTVPVGYRTGEDHNIENTILVRRYLNN